MKIEIDKSDLQSARALLSGIKGGANTAIYRAVNRGVSFAQTQAVKAIGQDLNLKAARIKSDFTMRKAKKGDLSGAVTATGQPVGLLQFGANKVKKGYSVKVKRKGKRTLLKHAFRAKTTKPKKNGSTYTTEHLWWRKEYGPSRTGSGTKYVRYFASLPAKHPLKEPLHRLSGPRIEDIFAKPKIYDPVVNMASEKVSETLMSEAENILSRYR